MFEYYQNSLCVHAGWLYSAGGVMTFSHYRKFNDKNRATKINILRRGCKGTPALVEYSSLPLRFRKKIEAQLGCHPEKLSTHKNSHAFDDAIIYDEKAAAFYAAYTFDDGRKLSLKRQAEYVSTAGILNAVQIYLLHRRISQKTRGGRTKKTWEQVVASVADLDKKAWPHQLPTHLRRFCERYKKYIKDGYTSLIHSNYCNKHSEKVHAAAGMWLLSRWSNQVERVANLFQLLCAYNEKAKEEGWKQLQAEETLRNFLNREDIRHLWYAHRHGDAASKQKFVYQHSTKLPTMRDSLWYGDGTKLNYTYRLQDKEGKWKLATCQVYEVIDAYSEVFLGHHISEKENYEAQFAAYKAAVCFAEHRPFEIRVDNQGGHKKLISGQLLDKIAHIAVKTQPYNAQSKTIESVFGRFQQQIMKKDWFFTGQNVKAKRQESQENREFKLKQPIEAYPTLDAIKARYAERRNEWNTAAHPATGQSRLEMYQQSHNPQSPALSALDRVNIFWILRPKEITYRASGLRMIESKEKHMYVKMKLGEPGMPDLEWTRRHVDKSYLVRFDPLDFSMIYCYEKNTSGDLVFVTEMELKILTNRGLQAQSKFEEAYYKKIEQQKRQSRLKAHDTMQEVLQTYDMDAESYDMITPGPLALRKKKRVQTTVAEAMKEESNHEEEVLVKMNEAEQEDVSIYELM